MSILFDNDVSENGGRLIQIKDKLVRRANEIIVKTLIKLTT